MKLKAKVQRPLFWPAAGLLGLTVVSFFLRFYLLGQKPLHHDESVNGWWLMQIWDRGYFAYDPTNYHGPLFFYLEHWLQVLLGKSLWILRSLPAFFSGITAIFLWQERKVIGSSLPAWAVALSPAFIFFGRSGIHESLFAFFQLMAGLGVLEFFRYDRRRGLLFFLVGVTASLCLKETWVVPVIAAGLTAGALWIWYKFIEKPPIKHKKNLQPAFWEPEDLQILKVYLPIMVFAWFLLYSGFGQHLSGLLDFFYAFLPWTKTGTVGNGHEKAWTYWLMLTGKYEPFFMLFIVASLGNFFVVQDRQDKLGRAFALFSFLNLLIYSAIPYKTPWCLLSVLWPFLISGGLFLNQQRLKKKWMPVILAAFCVMVQLPVIIHICYQQPLSPTHEYVYVQSTEDLSSLQNRMQEVAEQNPLLRNRDIDVVLDDVWPFPWAFTDWNHVHTRNVGNADYADRPLVIITEDHLQAEVESHLVGSYVKNHFNLRGGRDNLWVYWDGEVFQ